MEEVAATLNLGKRPMCHVKLVTTNVECCRVTETIEACCPPVVENKKNWRDIREYCSHLVPEKEIRLAELKLLYVKRLHERKSHDVEAREDPTSPWWQTEGKGGDLVSLHFFLVLLKNGVCVLGESASTGNEPLHRSLTQIYRLNPGIQTQTPPTRVSIT